jgi:hypothetical protein
MLPRIVVVMCVCVCVRDKAQEIRGAGRYTGGHVAFSVSVKCSASIHAMAGTIHHCMLMQKLPCAGDTKNGRQVYPIRMEAMYSVQIEQP